MKIVSVVAATLILSSGMMASSVQKITVPMENIALHNNQILVHRNGEWTCVGGISPDGKGLFLSESIPPCMARCSRIEFEASYKDITVSTGIDFDTNENKQQSERQDPPDSRDHAERDHAERDHAECEHKE